MRDLPCLKKRTIERVATTNRSRSQNSAIVQFPLNRDTVTVEQERERCRRWIGEKAVENHHKEVPYRLLKCVPKLSVDEPGSGNLLVQGDNLEALKALLPYYGGKVKCIYIDPPYNMGSPSDRFLTR